MANIDGNNKNNGLAGTDDDDVIQAFDGNDTVWANEGDDLVFGGGGNDVLWGWLGDDTLYGGTGNDTLGGDQGDDSLLGDAGDDIIYGSQGDDTAFGGSGDDRIELGSDDDVAYGDAGRDFIHTSTGNDSAFGGDDDDVIYAGTGNDTLFGDDGSDSLFAEQGNDVVYGGDGNDIAFLDQGNDYAKLGSHDDTAWGWTGNDTIYGESGNDTMGGDDGDDLLSGGTGHDFLIGCNDDDYLYGGKGRDVLVGEADDDHLFGGDDNDRLFGGTDNGSATFTPGGDPTSVMFHLGGNNISYTQDEIASVWEQTIGSSQVSLTGYKDVDDNQLAEIIVEGSRGIGIKGGRDTEIDNANGTGLDGEGIGVEFGQIVNDVVVGVRALFANEGSGSSSYYNKGKQPQGETGNWVAFRDAQKVGDGSFSAQNGSFDGQSEFNVSVNGGFDELVFVTADDNPLSDYFLEFIKGSITEPGQPSGGSVVIGDVLTGGSGADVFVYNKSEGVDLITDFNDSDGDVIEISGYNIDQAVGFGTDTVFFIDGSGTVEAITSSGSSSYITESGGIGNVTGNGHIFEADDFNFF